MTGTAVAPAGDVNVPETEPAEAGRAGAAPRWPNGHRFAFTIFDDTDHETVENGPAVYDLLGELGMRTTKSVWVLPPEGVPRIGGSACDDPEYLAWVLSLQRAGHEIALHNVSSSSSTRARTIEGFDRFRELFGHDPRTLANHVGNLEAMYHGEERVSGVRRAIYTVLTRGRRRKAFAGHVPGSDLFWGDLCRERVTYVRNFVYRDINTLKACPYMPYHDARRPYVRYFFASAEGGRPASFAQTISEANQDRLEAEGGLCIMYAHLGAGFSSAGKLEPEFERLMRRLARKDGWFAPVSEVLDHLRAGGGGRELGSRQRRELEWRWLADKVRGGGTS